MSKIEKLFLCFFIFFNTGIIIALINKAPLWVRILEIIDTLLFGILFIII